MVDFEEVEDLCDMRTDRTSAPIEAGLVLDWRNDKLDQNAYHQSSLCHETITPQTPNLQYGIYVTMVEIYNDKIYDLFEQVTSTPSKARSEIRLVNDAASRKVTLSKATKLFVSNVQEAIRILERGLKKRVSHSTGSNETSSRSHAIINLEIKATMRNSDQVRTSTITFADLAGTERNKLAGTQGIRFQESCAINRSLMLLSQGLQLQRGDERKTKPDYSIFRNCKLTHLLLTNTFRPDSNQKSVLLVAMDPFGDLNSAAQILRYASPVRDIPETLRRQNAENSFVFKQVSGIEFDGYSNSPKARMSRRTDSTKLNNALSSLSLRDTTPTPTTPTYPKLNHVTPPVFSPREQEQRQHQPFGYNHATPTNNSAYNLPFSPPEDVSPVRDNATMEHNVRNRVSSADSSSSVQSGATLAENERNQLDIMSLIPDSETACYNIQLMLERIQELEIALACSDQRAVKVDEEARGEMADVMDRALAQQKQMFLKELEEADVRARNNTDYRLQLLAQTIRASEVEPLQKYAQQTELETRKLKRENKELHQEVDKLKEMVRRGNSSSYGTTATFRPSSAASMHASSPGFRTPTRAGSPIKRGGFPGSPITIDN